MTNSDEEGQKNSQQATEATEAAAGPSVFDEQEVDYVTLDRNLTRMLGIIEQPWAGKAHFPPVKLNREHVDFLMKETSLNKVEVEGLLTRSKGDLKAAVELYLSSPLNQSFKA